MKIARKKRFLQALSDLIEQMYGSSTVYQKIMYDIDGVYYDKDEACNQWMKLQVSHPDVEPNLEQKQR